MTATRASKTFPLPIAEVRASAAHGRIGFSLCPGRQQRSSGPRQLDADLDRIAAWGARLVLTLVEDAELQALQVPRLGAEVRRRGMAWCHLPIADFAVPDADFERRWLAHGATIRTLLREGADVLVHCRGGLGRSGMMAARLLVELGVTPEQAIRDVRHARPGAIETPEQLAVVQRAQPLA